MLKYVIHFHSKHFVILTICSIKLLILLLSFTVEIFIRNKSFETIGYGPLKKNVFKRRNSGNCDQVEQRKLRHLENEDGVNSHQGRFVRSY